MGEDQFKNIIFAFLLMSLFGMLIISAVISIANDNDKDYSEVAGGSLHLDKFNESVSAIEEDAKSLKANLDEGSVWSSIAGVVVEGIFGIGKNMFLMILTPFDIISDIMSDTLGVPTYVTSVLLGLLILAVIFGLWNLIKIGN